MPRLDDPATARALHDRLVALGFRPDELRATLGSKEESPTVDRQLQLRRLPEGTPLATAAKLFALGLEVTPDDARAALAPVPLEALADLAVLELGGDAVRAPVRIFPFESYLIASDHPARLETRDAPADYVGAVNPTSLTLARLTVPVQAETALDLGTGCGVQALLLTGRARRVVATDVNPRALEFAAFNAALNGIDTIETRQGSFFEPVAGERFDLIASNPPFVVSPDTSFTFRDSGLRGDEVCREVVRGAATALTDGGFATVLCNWVSGDAESWRDAPMSWLEGADCDAWVLHSGSEDPLQYAAVWNQLLRRTDPAAYGEALDRWVEYDREIGAGALNYGAVILHRSARTPSWTAYDELPSGRIQSSGDHIVRVFAAHDRLRALPDENALLDERPTLVGGHRVEQVVRLGDREYEIEHAVLTLDEGLGFEGAVDPYALHVLARCDGERTLGEALNEVAAAAGVDRDAFTATGLRIVRRLYELGFLA